MGTTPARFSESYKLEELSLYQDQYLAFELFEFNNKSWEYIYFIKIYFCSYHLLKQFIINLIYCFWKSETKLIDWNLILI